MNLSILTCNVHSALRGFIVILSIFSWSAGLSQRVCLSGPTVHSNGVIEETGTTAPLPQIIIIPVVVHVVFNSHEENISDEQIRSQLAVLNQDFRKKNSDAAHVPAAFKEFAADSRIEFRLATLDPSGKPTTGIIRKQTSVTAFSADDKIKFAESGGDAAWSRDHYLNIWVGNIVGGVMGYASSPGCASEKDGVVIRYTNFGTTSNVKAPFNRGRTAVHEIGHWLGLRHIWGDADCGDDRIEDTPPQQGPTRGCPSGVVATCSSGTAGNMYMNFMDFTNDECTNMFTHGQAAKMRQLFAPGGERAALVLSDKAAGASPDDYLPNNPEAMGTARVYPNPAASFINIRNEGERQTRGVIRIFNHAGQIVCTVSSFSNVVRVDVSALRNGVYFVETGGGAVVKFLKAN